MLSRPRVGCRTSPPRKTHVVDHRNSGKDSISVGGTELGDLVQFEEDGVRAVSIRRAEVGDDIACDRPTDVDRRFSDGGRRVVALTGRGWGCRNMCRGRGNG